ncbi:hypothetical protein B7463_g8699, partial [Scytalidium lignicola]
MAYDFKWDFPFDFIDDGVWQGQMGCANGPYISSGVDLSDMMSNDTTPSQDVTGGHAFSGADEWDAGTLPSPSDAITGSIPKRSLSIWETSTPGVDISENFNPVDYQDAYQYSEGPPSSSITSRDQNSRRCHPSASSLARRRSQNRDSQRAFRARRQVQLKSLTEQFANLTFRHHSLEKDYANLEAKYKALLAQVKRSNEHDEAGDDPDSSRQDKEKEKEKAELLSAEQQYILDMEIELAQCRAYFQDQQNPTPQSP